jgi:N-acetylglucosaminyl-diphospho-decaprenol L-rhamnosyltransferase
VTDLRRVGVVIVTFNAAATVGETLAALPIERLGQVVVVDNGSSDASPSIARAAGVTVVEQENLGFGAGNNRGDAALDTELVLFLNPDAVLHASELERLVAHLDAHPTCAVVGPLVTSGGTATYAAGRLTSLATEIRPLLPDPLSRFGPERRLDPMHASSGPVGYVEGACFLVRREVLAQAGGFDEGYFLYFEELELAQRAKRLGWEVHLCAEATVEHVRAASTSKIEHAGQPHLVTSQVRYMRRWHGERAARLWVRAALASWRLRRAMGRLDRDRATALAAAARAALAGPAPEPWEPAR